MYNIFKEMGVTVYLIDPVPMSILVRRYEISGELRENGQSVFVKGGSKYYGIEEPD